MLTIKYFQFALIFQYFLVKVPWSDFSQYFYNYCKSKPEGNIITFAYKTNEFYFSSILWVLPNYIFFGTDFGYYFFCREAGVSWSQSSSTVMGGRFVYQ